MNKILDLFRRGNRHIDDHARLYGHFGMRVYDVKNGQKSLVLRITKKNQITNDGRRVMLELLRQTTLTPPQEFPNYNQLWSLSAGSSNIPAAVTDTGLYTPVWTSAFTSDAEIYVQDIPTLEIVVSKIMPETDAIGLDLYEAGLFTRGSLDDPSTLPDPTDWTLIPYRRMYARQTHPLVTKTNTMSIEYDWRLGVTVQGGP